MVFSEAVFMPRRVHIIGRKNSGKTTLIVELVQEFTRRGLRVGTVKHTHHHHELDTPGKDSFRHRQAGAVAVGLLAPTMNAVFWPADADEPASDRYSRFDALLSDCDLVLVEGHSRIDAPKVEVWRAAVSEQPFASSDDSIGAVISDDAVSCAVDVWPRCDVAALADRLLSLLSLSAEQRSPRPTDP